MFTQKGRDQLAVGCLGLFVLLLVFTSLAAATRTPPRSTIGERSQFIKIVTITPTPEQTATTSPSPTWTDLPTSTPPPAETLTPVEALRSAIETVLGESNRGVERVAQVDIEDGGLIIVKWSINDNLTENMVNVSARFNAVAILKAIYKSGIPYKVINLTGTFAMVDLLGNNGEYSVVFLMFDAERVKQINWSNEAFVDFSLYRNIYELANHHIINDTFK